MHFPDMILNESDQASQFTADNIVVILSVGVSGDLGRLWVSLALAGVVIVQ